MFILLVAILSHALPHEGRQDPIAAPGAAISVIVADDNHQSAVNSDNDDVPVIFDPTMTRLPSIEYPARAASKGITEGLAVLRCRIELPNQPVDCRVIDERPADAGFGRAAQLGIGSARFDAQEIEAAAAGADVVLTIRFQAR